MQFEIKDGGVDAEHSELWESHFTDDTTAWKLVRVPAGDHDALLGYFQRRAADARQAA